ncbi:MAG: adenine phosphoribosyltransferase [Spirochaetales bacterium]|jgi:adenine phosphoribosyltransferase|nr:adenine phosphoribosyltransferase [Spirochaetales bacterium]
MSDVSIIDNAIRKVKDFPKKGILFYDITGLLIKQDAFSFCMEKMVKLYENRGITKIAAVEARGFIFASPLALRLNVPLLLVRKKNKLPGEKLTKSYSLEYGEDSIEIHKNDIAPGDNVLVVDDLIATGGTIKAACELLESAGASVEEIFAVIGLPFLDYNSKLARYRISTFINYESE